MILAPGDPAHVTAHLVDARRDGLAQRWVRKVVHIDLLRAALRLPFPSAVFEGSNQLLCLRIDRDHGAPWRQEGFHLLIEIAKLGLALRVLTPFAGLGLGL